MRAIEEADAALAYRLHVQLNGGGPLDPGVIAAAAAAGPAGGKGVQASPSKQQQQQQQQFGPSQQHHVVVGVPSAMLGPSYQQGFWQQTPQGPMFVAMQPTGPATTARQTQQPQQLPPASRVESDRALAERLHRELNGEGPAPGVAAAADVTVSVRAWCLTCIRRLLASRQSKAPHGGSPLCFAGGVELV